MKLQKIESLIQAGKTEGGVAYLGGRPPRFIGLPVNETGNVDLISKTLTFKATITGSDWFTVLDSTGERLSIDLKLIKQSVKGIDGPGPAILPITNPALFDGMITIVPVIEKVETMHKLIQFFTEA
jgi:hypothetical protein